MKLKGIAVLLFIITASSRAVCHTTESAKACDYRLENIRVLISEPGKYSRAVLSPEADKILLFGKETTDVMDLNSKKVIKQFRQYFQGQWISNTAILFDVTGGFEIQDLNSLKTSSPVPVLEYVNNRKLLASEGDKTWTVAEPENIPNLVCFGYLFSKDFKKLVISTNTGQSFVYWLDGSGLLSAVDFGICTDWSDDNENIILFMDQDKGKDYTVSSDLYIHSIKTAEICKLTDSKDRIETWPSWSKNKVAFTDEKDGKVYLADIVKR